jgi:hypothetical protein
MKSFLIYLTLSTLLIICYCEKKYAGSDRNPSINDRSAGSRFFVGRFALKKGSSRYPTFRMRLQISDSFVKGSYRPVNSKVDVDLVGAVNSQNELILIESANGQTTGTFKGTLENGDNRLLRLSGVWTGVKTGEWYHFLVDEVR